MPVSHELVASQAAGVAKEFSAAVEGVVAGSRVLEAAAESSLAKEAAAESSMAKEAEPSAVREDYEWRLKEMDVGLVGTEDAESSQAETAAALAAPAKEAESAELAAGTFAQHPWEEIFQANQTPLVVH